MVDREVRKRVIGVQRVAFGRRDGGERDGGEQQGGKNLGHHDLLVGLIHVDDPRAAYHAARMGRTAAASA